MKKQYLLIVVALLFSFCSKKENAIVSEITLVNKESNDSLLFERHWLQVSFTNKSYKPYYITDIGFRLFYEQSFISANYGSWQKRIDCEIETMKKYKKGGSVTDTLFVKIIKNDTCNVTGSPNAYRIINHFEDIYFTQWRYLSANPYSAPVPYANKLEYFYASHIDSSLVPILAKQSSADSTFSSRYFFGENVLLPPRSTRKFEYDIGYLFLQRGVYVLEYDLDYSFDILTSEDIRFTKITGFEKYKGTIKSNRLIIVSE